MNDRIESILGEKVLKERSVTDVAVDKAMPFCLVQREVFEVAGVARIGQCIQVDDGPLGFGGQGMANEVGADEAGATRDKKIGHTAPQ